MIKYLKEIHTYNFIDEETIVEAEEEGIEIIERNPIKIPYKIDEFPRITNLESTNMIFRFVCDKFNVYVEEIKKNDNSEKYFIEKLNIDFLKKHFYPFQVNIDLVNNIIEIENTYEYYNLIQLFKENRTSNQSTLFFMMNKELYFYNEQNFGFCEDAGFSINEINFIKQAFSSEENGLETISSINGIKFIKEYKRETFSSYFLESIE